MTAIVDVRAKLATTLAPIAEDDPPVLDTPSDSVAPPCLMLGWGAPMVDFTSATPCNAKANLQVTIIAGRLDLPTAFEVIEVQYQRVQQLLRDAGGWAISNDSGPVPLEIARTLYLCCVLDVRTPVQL